MTFGKEQKDELRRRLHENAEAQATLLIDMAEKMYAAIPDGSDDTHARRMVEIVMAGAVAGVTDAYRLQKERLDRTLADEGLMEKLRKEAGKNGR